MAPPPARECIGTAAGWGVFGTAAGRRVENVSWADKASAVEGVSKLTGNTREMTGLPSSEVAFVWSLWQLSSCHLLQDLLGFDATEIP